MMPRPVWGEAARPFAGKRKARLEFLKVAFNLRAPMHIPEPVRRLPALRWFFHITLALHATALVAGDILYHSLDKGVYYAQQPGAAPALKTPLPYLIRADMLTASDRVNAVLLRSLVIPYSGRFLIPQGIPANGTWAFVDRHASQASLDAAWPAGKFSFDVTVFGPMQYYTNTLPATSFPPAPRVDNLVAAQSIDASSAFTLAWLPFAGGTTNDLIHLQVFSSTGAVFATGFTPRATNALDGLATTVAIPAGTLSPGHACLGRLTFYKFTTTVTNSFPAAFGTYGFYAQTDFYLATAGAGDATPPTVASSSPGNDSLGVPTNTPVAFYFSKTMRAAHSITFPGYGTSLRFWWSPDTRTYAATMVYSNFVANRLHTFILNPHERAPTFADTNGNPLAADTVVQFTTGTGRLPVEPAAWATPTRLTTGFALTAQGVTNYAYTLLASTNLSNWVVLQTNLAYGGWASFVDTNAPLPPARFYRAVAY